MSRVTIVSVMASTLLVFAATSRSQDRFDDIAFELTLSGRAHDVGNAVVELADGGYAVVGYTEFPGATGGGIMPPPSQKFDLIVTKVNAPPHP